MVNHWWLLILRGLLIIALGLSIVIKPMMAALGVVLIFGGYGIINALISLVSFAAGLRKRFLWWMDLILALVSLTIGLIIIEWPQATLFFVIQLFSLLILVSGIVNLIVAQQMRKQLQKEWRLTITGIVKVLFALGLVLIPDTSLTVFMWVIGLFAIGLGINETVYAFRLRNLKNILTF
jgi:uncharacterized membrane protein HdeD (DUF308 family)